MGPTQTIAERLAEGKRVLATPQRYPLLVVRLLYFCYYMAFSIYVTYINIYFLSIDLTGLQIGLINTISPLLGMISSPMWGMFSDRLGNVRFLMMMAVGGASLSILGFTTTQTYLAILFLAGAYSLFTSSIVPLLDSTTLLQLGTNREKYGLIRVWGTGGFIIAAWVSGSIFEEVGLDVMFYWMAIILLIFFVMLLWLPGRRVTLRTPVISGFLQLIRHPSWFFFSASLLVMGVASSGLHIFLGILIKEIGGTDALVGKAYSLGALTEIPIMLSSVVLLKRFSPRLLLSFAYILYFIRLLLFGVITSTGLVLPINLLHGVTFGLYWIASIAIANEIAPDSLRATAQGTLMAILSFSGALGGFISGWIFDIYGTAWLFRIYSVFALIALLLLWFMREGYSDQPS
jgi:PPP family 3-phenylpropionic acid transporter